MLKKGFCKDLPRIVHTFRGHSGDEEVNPFTLRVTLESIVCYSHTFENNLGIKRKFIKYLKESCSLASDQHFSIKCSQKKASVSKIFHKSSGLYGRFEW